MGGPNTALGARARWPWLVLGLLCCSGTACDGPGLSPSAGTALLGTRAQHFEQFDRWARRAMVADSARRDRGSLSETIFAPIRRDEEVVSARVERRGPAALALSRHRGWVAPESLSFQTVRDERLGDVRVARGRIDDPRRSSAPPVEVLVVSRAQRAGGAEVEVTVAYVIDEGETP